MNLGRCLFSFLFFGSGNRDTASHNCTIQRREDLGVINLHLSVLHCGVSKSRPSHFLYIVVAVE
jgi:hypothetical protein